MSTETNPRIGELLARLNTENPDSLAYLELCRSLGDEYMEVFAFQEAQAYYYQMLQEAEKRDDASYLQPIALSRLAMIAGRQGRHPEGLELNIKALAILENTDPSVRNNELYASILGNIGLHYQGLAEFAHAREFFLRALNYYEIMGDEASITRNYVNLGLLSSDLGDVESAFEFLKKALALAESSGRTRQIASILSSIANVYHQIKDLALALDFNHQALAYARESGSSDFQASILGNIGVIYMTQHEYNQALVYHEESRELSKQLGRVHGAITTLTNIASASIALKKFDQSMDALSEAVRLAEELHVPELIAFTHGGLGTLYAEAEYDARNSTQAIEHLRIATELIEYHGLTIQNGEFHKILADIYAENGEGMKAYLCFKEYDKIRERIYNEQVTSNLRQFGFERKLAEEKAQTREREKILLKIFPENIAKRLIASETFIADSYQSVTVFFSDIVDFTSLSTRISAEELVGLLNSIFTKFDHIASRYGLEKIKTIGDSYMAVAGAPERLDNHAERAAGFALEVSEMIDNYRTISGEKIHVRIGLHTGSVVAGVIGENKFAYDLWGDAVNTASRMESHGVAGKIHVSEDFVQAIRGAGAGTIPASSLRFIERGEQEIKGKGLMKTYFLERAS
ncbi:MAG: adenylate/guanylate cyclase domain-containing protein [Candidatus Kapaibacterium sp.]